MPDKPKATTAQSLGSLIKSCRDIMRKDRGLSTDLDRLPVLTWIMFLKFLDDMEHIREMEAKLENKRFLPTIEPPYRWRDWAAPSEGISGDALIAFINNDEATLPDGKRGPGLFAYLKSLHSRDGDRRDVVRTVFERTVNRMMSGFLLRDIVNKVNSIHFTSTEEIFTLGHLYESMLKGMRDAAGDSGEFYTPRPVVQFIVAAINPRLGETILDPACGTGGFLAAAFDHLKPQCNTAEDHQRLQRETLSGIEAKPLPYLLCQMNLLLHGLEYPGIDPLNALRFRLSEMGEKDRVDVIMTNPPFGGEEEKGIQGNFPEDKKTAETALLFLQLIMRKLRKLPKAGFPPARAAVVVPESVMSDMGVATRIRKVLIEDFNLHTVIRLPKGVFEPYSDIQTNILFFDRGGTTTNTWFYEHAVPEGRQNMRNPCYTRSSPLRFEELQPILDWWPAREETIRAWVVPVSALMAKEYSFDFRNPRLTQAEKASPEQIVSSLARPLEESTVIVGHMKDASTKLKSLDTSSWKKFALDDFLAPSRNEASLDEDTTYKQITVRLYGKGAVLRKTIPGAEIRARPQFVAKAGQLIMSRIDARNGAFSIVPQELDGAVVSQDFPLFDVNDNIVERDFLPILLHSHSFLEACKRASRGTTNRKRLNETFLLGELVPLPDKPDQRAIADFVAILRSLDGKVESLKCIADSAIPCLANYLFG